MGSELEISLIVALVAWGGIGAIFAYLVHDGRRLERATREQNILLNRHSQEMIQRSEANLQRNIEKMEESTARNIREMQQTLQLMHSDTKKTLRLMHADTQVALGMIIERTDLLGSDDD